MLSIPEYTTKDSGEREEFPTGARRDTRTGKGRFDLLPWDVVWRDAKALERGAEKYGGRNWEKGMPISRFFDSAVRHLCSYALGDRSEDHLAAARFNIAGMMRFENNRELDNLPGHEERWRTKTATLTDTTRRLPLALSEPGLGLLRDTA